MYFATPYIAQIPIHAANNTSQDCVRLAPAVLSWWARLVAPNVDLRGAIFLSATRATLDRQHRVCMFIGSSVRVRENPRFSAQPQQIIACNRRFQSLVHVLCLLWQAWQSVRTLMTVDTGSSTSMHVTVEDDGDRLSLRYCSLDWPLARVPLPVG